MSDDIERDMSVTEWAAKRNISVPTAHKIFNSGLGPETFEVPGIRGRRITPAADAAWEKRMYARSKTKAVRRAAERRQIAAQNAANISAQSPMHVSKKGKKLFPKAPPPDTKRPVRPRKHLEVVT